MHGPYRVQDHKYNRPEGVGETVALGVQTCLHRAYWTHRSPVLRTLTDAIDARVDACAALFLQTHETTQGASAAGRSDREIIDSPYPTSWFSRESVTRPYSISRFIRDSVVCLSSVGMEDMEMQNPPRAIFDELYALEELQNTLEKLKELDEDEDESVEDLKQKLEALKDQKLEQLNKQLKQNPPRRATFDELYALEELQDTMEDLKELNEQKLEQLQDRAFLELKELDAEVSVEDLKQKLEQLNEQQKLEQLNEQRDGVEDMEMQNSPRATFDELYALEELQDTLEELKELDEDENESVEDLKQKLAFLQQKLEIPKKKKKSFLRSLPFRRTQTSKT